MHRPKTASRFLHTRALSLLALNKKQKPENLKFFYGFGHRTRARKVRRYIFPPRCSSVHSCWHRYSGTNTIYLYFSPLFGFIMVPQKYQTKHKSTTNLCIYIHQSMWQMFSVGPAFRGITMIPPTSHFLFYTSS